MKRFFFSADSSGAAMAEILAAFALLAVMLTAFYGIFSMCSRMNQLAVQQEKNLDALTSSYYMLDRSANGDEEELGSVTFYLDDSKDPALLQHTDGEEITLSGATVMSYTDSATGIRVCYFDENQPEGGT